VKAQVYIDPRPAELFEKYHRRVRERGPDWVYSLARTLLTPPVWVLYRSWPISVENVPDRGPAILAPNHFSNLDHFFLGLFLRRRVQFMAKSQLFRFPLDFILSHGGTFPVRRGQKDEEAFVTAHDVLLKGGVVGMYGEGGRSRSKQLGQPKPGLGRLALEAGVPVIPVAIHGSEHVREARFPKVTIQYGEPVTFERLERPGREQCQRASVEIFERIRAMYGALQRQGRNGVIRALRRKRRETSADERLQAALRARGDGAPRGLDSAPTEDAARREPASSGR
jgi:1-acyl-sn-glycerol-3-phosphate acyltransferase